MECKLCGGDSVCFFKGRHGEYFRCSNCKSVFLSSLYLPGREKEKKRYEFHNNDIEDEGYCKFVFPIIKNIVSFFSLEHKGLDFGCGPGPVISHLLKKKGFSLDLYDPFFENNRSIFSNKYDFIVCCEVIEHFHNPQKEFSLLYSLLKPAGKLYCMTYILTDDIDFEKWHYKNDFTHVFFYHPESFKFVREYFGFTSFNIEDRLIIFEK